MTPETTISDPQFSVEDPVLVHVGLHKTGTTWLQQRVFQALDGQGIAFCGDLDLIYRTFIVPEIAEFSVEPARQAFADLLQTARTAGQLPVISGESLAGRPFHTKYQRAVVAQRIAQVFPNARILLTIREQTAIIRSMYGQYIRFGYTSNIHQFLKRPPAGSSFSPVLDWDFYDFARLIREYRTFFAPDRVLVLPFERFVSDADWAMRRIGDSTGVDLSRDLPDTQPAKTSNPAWSVPAYNAVRTLNRFISQDARWQRPRGRFSPNAIGYWANRLTPDRLRQRLDDRWRQIVAEAAGDYYQSSNRDASDLIGLDLGSLGYAC